MYVLKIVNLHVNVSLRALIIIFIMIISRNEISPVPMLLELSSVVFSEVSKKTTNL